MDLVELQTSAKRIRNPFGFDFVHTWNGKPIMLKGDGEWRQVVGPLREHLARHLFMKIMYQYHDEQVRAFKAKGQVPEARKFHVSQEVENKIWFMITGELLHDDTKIADEVQDAADLTELKNEISKLDKAASGSGGEVTNITKVLDEANMEALKKAGDVAGGEAAKVKGTAEVLEKPVEDEKTKKAEEKEEPQAAENSGEEEAFGSLQQLD